MKYTWQWQTFEQQQLFELRRRNATIATYQTHYGILSLGCKAPLSPMIPRAKQRYLKLRGRKTPLQLKTPATSPCYFELKGSHRQRFQLQGSGKLAFVVARTVATKSTVNRGHIERPHPQKSYFINVRHLDCVNKLSFMSVFSTCLHLIHPI